jgi:hypothetical protein
MNDRRKGGWSRQSTYNLFALRLVADYKPFPGRCLGDLNAIQLCSRSGPFRRADRPIASRAGSYKRPGPFRRADRPADRRPSRLLQGSVPLSTIRSHPPCSVGSAGCSDQILDVRHRTVRRSGPRDQPAGRSSEVDHEHTGAARVGSNGSRTQGFGPAGAFSPRMKRTHRGKASAKSAGKRCSETPSYSFSSTRHPAFLANSASPRV